MPEDGQNNQNPVENQEVSSNPNPVVAPAVTSAEPAATDVPLSTPASQPQNPQTFTPKQPGNRKKLGFLAAVVIGVIVLLGGSAAAYYGLVVANKPENVLKKAFDNISTQHKAKFDGKFTYESTDEKAVLKAVNVAFNGAADADTNAFQSAIEVTASGVKVPFELRHVDKSLFFKVGDLSSVKGLAQSAAPQYAGIVDAVNQKIANQWIEVDETLLKQAKSDCILNSSFMLTKEDVELLQKRYKEVPFAKVAKTSDDKVNGRAAIKYEIEIDDNKGAEYAKGLQELSLVKKLKQCYPEETSAAGSDTSSLADNDITPLILWVDKGSKQIVKLAGHSTKQDEEKDKLKADFEVTLQYGSVSIDKPADAKPFMQIFGDITELFSGGIDTLQPGGDGTTPAHCTQDFLEYQRSNGTKPIPADCFY